MTDFDSNRWRLAELLPEMRTACDYCHGSGHRGAGMIQLLKHKSKEKYAARIRDLGLTAYGATKEEALLKSVEMLRAFLLFYLQHNQVSGVLSRAAERPTPNDVDSADWEWAYD